MSANDTDMKSEITVNEIKLIDQMILEGRSLEDISQLVRVELAIVMRIYQDMMLRRGDSCQLERFNQLAAHNLAVSPSKVEALEEVAKAQGVWLLGAGLQPPQLHIASGMTIFKCRHLETLVKTKYSRIRAAIPIPETLSARIIISIFASHYLYLQKVACETSVTLLHVVIAWLQTIQEVAAAKLDQMDDYDPSLLGLGTAYEAARGLRETRRSDDPRLPASEGKRLRKLGRAKCGVCGCEFIYIDRKNETPKGCCFCEYKAAYCRPEPPEARRIVRTKKKGEAE